MEHAQVEPLKIAVLVKNFHGYGGAEKYAVEVTQRLAAMGHAIDLYAWAADKRLVVDGIRHIKVPCRYKFSSFMNLWSFGREVAALLDPGLYDAVISHDRTWGQDISVVHTFSYKTGLERYAPIRKVDQVWLSPRAWVYLMLERRQMGRQQLVPVSHVIRADIEKHYPGAGAMHVVSPGIDPDMFSPTFVAEKRETVRQKEGLRPDELVVLFVGSEFRRKGLDLTIPAIGEGMRLLIAGRGEHLAHYKRLAETSGNSDRVTFLGLQKDVLPWYAAADVVVLPSVAEAFGMTVLEGMACGLPVIAGENAGAAALIDHGQNGFVCAGTQDISRTLSELRDGELRRRIGAAGRITALENSWDCCAKSYESLCISVAGQK
ncbi:MAG: glycosyltransferase family 4 protein [Desulfobacterium sp.]|nr:glycosyltransferase family 4 protein [Desulfobacterium sp.]